MELGISSSKDTILKLELGVEPGWVEIMPLNLVTHQLRTWLYSLHTDTRYFSDNVTRVTGDLGQSVNEYQILERIKYPNRICKDKVIESNNN